MSNSYLRLDDAVGKVVELCRDFGGLNIETTDDQDWLRNELEQVCEIRTCDRCRGAVHTSDPFKVFNGNRDVYVTFNFCPVCGRDLRSISEPMWGDVNDT